MPSLTPMYLKRNGDWDNNIYIWEKLVWRNYYFLKLLQDLA
jgi:hypothetical protein